MRALQVILSLLLVAHPVVLFNINSLIELNIEAHQLVYVINHQKSSKIESKIQQISHFPLRIVTGNHQPVLQNNSEPFFKPQVVNAFVVLFCKKLTKCFNNLIYQVNNQIINPRRKVFIELGLKDWNDEELLSILKSEFQRLWEQNMLNVVVEFRSNQESVNHISYNPFGREFLTNLTGR